MSFDLSKQTDQRALDTLIDGIMAAVAAGDATAAQARYLWGHLIILAGKGDENAIRDWLADGRVDKWREECRAARS